MCMCVRKRDCEKERRVLTACSLKGKACEDVKKRGKRFMVVDKKKKENNKIKSNTMKTNKEAGHK